MTDGRSNHDLFDLNSFNNPLISVDGFFAYSK